MITFIMIYCLDFLTDFGEAQANRSSDLYNVLANVNTVGNLLPCLVAAYCFIFLFY